MNLGQKIEALLGTVVTDIEADAKKLWSEAEPWLVDTLQTIEHDAVTTLIPFAAEAIGEVSTGIGGTLTPAQTGAALTATMDKAIAAEVAVTSQDAAQAVASVAASLTKGAAAANQAAVATVTAVTSNTAAAAQPAA